MQGRSDTGASSAAVDGGNGDDGYGAVAMEKKNWRTGEDWGESGSDLVGLGGERSSGSLEFETRPTARLRPERLKEGTGGRLESSRRFGGEIGRESNRVGVSGWPQIAGPRLTMDGAHGRPWEWLWWPRERA